MKYVLLSVAALAIVFGLSFLATGLIRRKLKKKPSVSLHILISVAVGLLLLAAVGFIFLSIHYPAEQEAETVFAGSDGVTVTAIDGGYLADGFGEKTALIFYPGAKVDTTAYLPLMKQIAAGGVDCFLVDPPMRMAIFDPDAADRIIDGYHYNYVMVGGHSMGGMVAAGYAAEHPVSADGVVLLAAYPTKPPGSPAKLLSIYGTEDRVLDREAYEKSKRYFPPRSTEIVIDGGNHAQFGNYGLQKGDGAATISAQEQQSQTVEAILQFAQQLSEK